MTKRNSLSNENMLTSGKKAKYFLKLNKKRWHCLQWRDSQACMLGEHDQGARAHNDGPELAEHLNLYYEWPNDRDTYKSLQRMLGHEPLFALIYFYE